MTLSQPPFSMKSKAGEAIGMDVEIAELLAQSLELKLNIVEMPFHELLPSLESGKIDLVISGMAITAERNLKFSFVGPYMISGKGIITKSAILAKAGGSEDIDKEDLRVAAMKGTTSEKFTKSLLSHCKLVSVENYEEGIAILMDNKADLMIADYPICILAQIRYPNAGFVTTEEPLTIEPIGIALPANAPQLTNLIDNYLKSLALTGILDELEDFWFTNPKWVSDMGGIQFRLGMPNY